MINFAISANESECAAVYTILRPIRISLQLYAYCLAQVGALHRCR